VAWAHWSAAKRKRAEGFTAPLQRLQTPSMSTTAVVFVPSIAISPSVHNPAPAAAHGHISDTESLVALELVSAGSLVTPSTVEIIAGDSPYRNGTFASCALVFL
jgi:hypothetical protein